MDAIILCGIQASGKSSFYRERFADTHVRLSLDLLKTRNREDILLYACLAAQQSFVIDNTNPLPDTRSRYARIAKASGFRCTLYYFDCSADDALRRNTAREGVARVPDLAIRGAFAKFVLPNAAEGFDAMYKVRLL